MKLKVSLLTMLLVVSVVAVWISYFTQKNENDEFSRKLPALRDIARELDVTDPSLLHVVAQHPEWKGERKWKVHVPSDGYFALSLLGGFAIPDSANANTANASSIQLESGVRTVEVVTDESTDTRVLVDGKETLCLDYLYTGFNRFGSQRIQKSTVFQLDEKAVLVEKRVGKAKKLTSGIMIWIEKVSAADAGRLTQ